MEGYKKDYSKPFRDYTEHEKTYASCMTAVKEDGWNLEYVPEQYLTKELCLAAVCSAVIAYKYVPHELLTPDFVNEVYKISGYTELRDIPSHIRNDDFYLELIKLNKCFFWSIPSMKLMNPLFFTLLLNAMGYETLAEAVAEEPRILGKAPPSLYTKEACLAFVSSEFFSDVCESMVNEYYLSAQEPPKGVCCCKKEIEYKYHYRKMLQWSETAEAILRLGGVFLKFVEPSIITRELCSMAVENDVNAIEYVPEEYRSNEMCNKAYESGCYYIQFFPERFFTEDWCKKAIMDNPRALQFLPEKFKTEDIKTLANTLLTSGRLGLIPENELNENKVLKFLRNNDLYAGLNEIPNAYKNESTIATAVERNGNLISQVPKEYMSKEMCMIACKSRVANAETLFLSIPRKLLTSEMCDILVDRSISVYEYVPNDLITRKQVVLVGQNQMSRLISKFPDQYKTLDVIKEIIGDDEEERNEFLSAVKRGLKIPDDILQNI